MINNTHSYTLFSPLYSLFFFFNDTATTEIYTLSLHDALPISADRDAVGDRVAGRGLLRADLRRDVRAAAHDRSEEHTSELQSRRDLVCRLLLEKKNKKKKEEYALLTHTSIQTITKQITLAHYR